MAFMANKLGVLFSKRSVSNCQFLAFFSATVSYGWIFSHRDHINGHGIVVSMLALQSKGLWLDRPLLQSFG